MFPPAFPPEEVETWVTSQWKLMPLVGQSRHLVEQSQLHNGGIRYGTSSTQERLNN
jgi:hypothetical protein